jgi:hypothetical protein
MFAPDGLLDADYALTLREQAAFPVSSRRPPVPLVVDFALAKHLRGPEPPASEYRDRASRRFAAFSE